MQVKNLSPFSSSRDEHFVLSLLKILAAPLSIFEMRFLKPVKLSEVETEDQSVSENIENVIKKSLQNPSRDQLNRLPQERIRQATHSLPQRENINPQFQQRVNSVMEVFPQVDRNAVIAGNL